MCIQLTPSQQQVYYDKIVAPLLRRFVDYRLAVIDIAKDTIVSHLLHLFNGNKQEFDKFYKELYAYKTASVTKFIAIHSDSLFQKLITSNGFSTNTNKSYSYTAVAIWYLNYVISMFYVMVLETDPSFFFKNHVVFKAYMECMCKVIERIQKSSSAVSSTIANKLSSLNQLITSDMFKYKIEALIADSTEYTAPYLKAFNETVNRINLASDRVAHNVVYYATGSIHIDDRTNYMKQHPLFWNLSSYRAYLLSVCNAIDGAHHTNLNFKRLLAWLYCKRISGKKFNSVFGFGGEVAKDIKDVTIDDVNQYMILMDNNDRRQPYKGFNVQLTSPMPPYTYKDILALPEYTADEGLLSLNIGTSYPLYTALKNKLLNETDVSINKFDFCGDYDE